MHSGARPMFLRKEFLAPFTQRPQISAAVGCTAAAKCRSTGKSGYDARSRLLRTVFGQAADLDFWSVLWRLSGSGNKNRDSGQDAEFTGRPEKRSATGWYGSHNPATARTPGKRAGHAAVRGLPFRGRSPWRDSGDNRGHQQLWALLPVRRASPQGRAVSMSDRDDLERFSTQQRFHMAGVFPGGCLDRKTGIRIRHGMPHSRIPAIAIPEAIFDGNG